MPLMKGSAFSARFAYLKTRFPDRWPEFLAALGPTTRDIAEAGALRNAWYPFEAFIDLNVCAERLFGTGNLAKVMGRYAAEANLPTLYRLFYKVGSPEYILGKAAMLWSVHHDTGRAELVRLERRFVEYQIHGFAKPHDVLCRSVEGFIEKSLELTGAKNIKVFERQCAAGGAQFCAFRGRWD